SPANLQHLSWGSGGVGCDTPSGDAGPGEKLTDAELLGCPLRITVGRRALAEGAVEAQVRRSGAEERLPIAEAAADALELLDGLD
ncbi:MAG: His/Gly/Thr/Pro-type tRNA ligase C-terminal domain-containing protein, partial [Actinomycetota bacterium]